MLIKRLGIVVFGVALLALAWESATHSVDFPIYHRVATQILQGNYELYPTELYDGGLVPPHGFRYAPAIAFLLVPLGWLPLEVAAFLFFSLKVAAFVYVGALVARYMGLPARRRALMLTSLLFVGGYVVEEFRYGNVHFFCVALMALAFDSAERGKIAIPATALGLAIAIKLTPIMLLGYFALRRRVGLCLATVGVLVLVWVAPAMVVGYQLNNHLVEGFAKYAVEKIDEQDNYALRGVLVRYLTPDHRQDLTNPNTSLADLSAPTVSAIWVLMVVAGGLVLAVTLWPEPSEPSIRLLEFSLILTAMLLASPHTQRRYFTALYVPVLTLLGLRRGATAPRQARAVRVGLVVTAAASTFLPLAFVGRKLSLAYEAFSPYFFATLMLFVALMLITSRLKATHAPPGS
jgi:Glycosyltransferase family 87